MIRFIFYLMFLEISLAQIVRQQCLLDDCSSKYQLAMEEARIDEPEKSSKYCNILREYSKCQDAVIFTYYSCHEESTFDTTQILTHKAEREFCSRNWDLDTNELGESRSENLSNLWQIIENERTDYILTVAHCGPPGVPSFPDPIKLANITLNETYDPFYRYEYYTNIGVHNFHSAYSVKHRINLREQKIHTRVSLGNMQIRGFRSNNLNESGEGFEKNFNRPILWCETTLTFQNGTFIFEEILPYSNHHSHYEYVNPTSRTIDDEMWLRVMPEQLIRILKRDLCRVLRNATCHDGLRSQIQREISDMYRDAISQRLGKTLVTTFKYESSGMSDNMIMYNQLHFDTTNFRITHQVRGAAGKMYSYDMTIPSFRFRGRERAVDMADLIVDNTHTSFTENEVHLRAKIELLSPLLAATIIYRDGLQDQNKTLEAMYQLNNLTYILGVVARLDTKSIKLEYTRVKPSHFEIKRAADRVIFDDEKSDIVEGVRGFLQSSSYIAINCNHTFRHYIESVLPLEQIAAEIFTAKA